MDPVVLAGDPGTGRRAHLMEVAAGLEDVISLGRADPDLPTPPEILEAALDRANHPVTADPVLGLSELRRAITHRYAEERLLDLDPERCILITNGAQEAMFLAMLSLVDPGDLVVTHDPRRAAYERAVTAAGGSLRAMPTAPDGDFRLDARTVLDHAADAKLLVFANPNDPTGALVEREAVHEIAEAARDLGVIVVADEVYSDLVYDGGPFQSVAACRGMQEWTVTFGGFSKTYAMTGFRVGYLIGEPRLIRAAAALKAAISGPCPRFSQHAAIAAIEVRPDPRKAFLEVYGARRNTMLEGLDRIGIRHSNPRGGLFVWADLSSFGLETDDFCLRLLEETGVLLSPGGWFGEPWRSWVRISLLAPEDEIAEALARMEGFVASL